MTAFTKLAATLSIWYTPSVDVTIQTVLWSYTYVQMFSLITKHCLLYHLKLA